MKELLLDSLYMDYPNDQGVTNRKHLNQVWDQTGQKPEQYRDLIPPIAGEDLFQIFWDLKNFTGEYIGWPDVYYYCLYNDIQLEYYEIKILQRLNGEYNRFMHKKIKDRNKPKSHKKASPKKPPMKRPPRR